MQNNKTKNKGDVNTEVLTYFPLLATDFVGLSTTSISDAIMIDTTPPTVSDVYTLDVGGSFLVSTKSVSPR